MRLLDRLAQRLGYVPAKTRARSHGYAAAELSRLTASLSSESQYINNTLRYQLRILRARSRQATQNNPFGRRFAQMVVDNICGPVPFRLQAKVKSKAGKIDVSANRRIESEWAAWGRKGSCEITERWSWSVMQRLLVRILATDGELLLRQLTGPEQGRHGYRLQVIDVDRLDDLKNQTLAGGGAIHMGIEMDAYSRPVAYHLLKRKPSDWQRGAYTRETERVPASEIIHFFIPEFAEQVRGVPWMYAALLNLVHLGAFEEAAVIAARVGASSMGIIETPDGGQTLAQQQGQTDTTEPSINAEPGVFQFLPPGYKMSEGWDPKYPDAAIEPFVKACLRGVAVGVGVAYHNLSGDMEGVNYSSARIAELDERDSWMVLQNAVSEHLHQPIYDAWLRLQILLGTLPFNAGDVAKYRAVYWQGRRWAWVDPAKEVRASLDAIEGKLKSRTRVIAEAGEDIEDVFDEIVDEERLAKEKNISLELPKKTSTGNTVVADQGDGTDNADASSANA